MNDNDIYEWYKMELCDLLDKKSITITEAEKIEYILSWIEGYKNKGVYRK